MSAITLALLIFGVMLVFMAVRVPIAIAMFAAGGIGYVMQTGWGPFSSFLNTQAFARFASYDLSVIPLFILMGHFATQGGISRALFGFAAGVMGRFKGGLAMASILACAAFGAICGSSVATAATITGVALPEMKRHGYSGRLATGTLAAGGTLGILIPPSVPLVIYAILTEQNIAKLFAAAMVPGIIAMIGYMVAIAIYVRVVPGQAPEVDNDRPPLTLASLLGILPIAIIFVIVFGGIYGGLFTPTEGAAVGAAATFVAALLKREITWAKFKLCFYATAESSAMIFLIFIGADLMNSALALTQVPNQLAGVVGGWGLSPLMVVTAILLFYVVLGAVMDELSMLLLTIPIFFPMVMGLDFGMSKESTAIWFGIMVLMTVGFGMLAPPVGLNVYVVNGLAKDVPISESYKGVMPFLISDTLRTILLLLFPGISLWLVKYIS
ncbi:MULTISPECIES: TRAP transporter large permease [unclassified Polaromonas]|uniref:TRAP transporter large permease n=1 Tax=unclassified Polaromonas TaxID=2638319 RepID=UPI000F07E4A6|nr:MULTISPECIES: TRAP transporter large permease [unclassified Polaromonas]AYQ30028.1 TRAP transporter large permease [Polaromonas sp. SP1]QGJ18858.1 TRAP transporter large permease subunit [Polaromonas sp. Pch-P]